MHELTRVTLDNEMDLILAHKRSMRLAEICGLSLSAQTTFATAVSEVSRMSIESGRKSYLSLSLDLQKRDSYIVASLKLERSENSRSHNGLEYAKRLVAKYNVSVKGNETLIELFYYVSPAFRIDAVKIDEWRNSFRNEPPVSPYEELKRKNEQLQVLSEKVQNSEAAYKNLTNSLPLFIFTVDEEGSLLYANEWLTRYTGESIEELNKSRWKDIVHPEDYPGFGLMLEKNITKGAAAVTLQSRLKNNAEKEYYWHQLTLSPFINDKTGVLQWNGYIADIHAQKIYEETLKDNAELKEAQSELKDKQEQLERSVRDLNRSNLELQQFAFVASHDLQEPVRKLLYYSDTLLNDYTGKLDEKGNRFLSGMNTSAKRMRSLIKDLLIFSQINKSHAEYEEVDLNKLMEEGEQDLELLIKDKKALIEKDQLPVIRADKRMIRQLFENILSNSLKYSRHNVDSRIAVTQQMNGNTLQVAIADNGIGFDEKYLPNMFDLFQRLHGKDEYEGTGMGLAICKKIVDIHQGRIWAKGKEGEGATFFIELPVS